MRHWIAEQAHQTVAEFFRDMTAHFGDGSGSGIEIGADQVAPLLGIELRGNRGRSDQIAKHDGEISTFTRRRGSICWCKRS